MTSPLTLRCTIAEDLRTAWVTEAIAEVAADQGWSVEIATEHDRPVDAVGRPDAVAVVVALGTEIVPVDEPLVAVRVEGGTPRSPVVEESPPHLPARLDLTVGAFRARRNQRVTRDALERFFDRVERTRPVRFTRSDDTGEPVELDPAEAVARADAGAIVAENRALLDAVDAWLARTSMTPDAAPAIGADRTILEAAIAAPIIDLVIVERAAARLAAALAD